MKIHIHYDLNAFMGIGCFENLDSKNTILREKIHSSEPLVVDLNSLVRLVRAEPDASCNEVSETNLTLLIL